MGRPAWLGRCPGAGTADAKAMAYQDTLTRAIESCFPLKTVRRKNTWLDRKTKKMINDRKLFFIEEGGRTAAWKEEKKKDR